MGGSSPQNLPSLVVKLCHLHSQIDILPPLPQVLAPCCNVTQGASGRETKGVMHWSLFSEIIKTWLFNHLSLSHLVAVPKLKGFHWWGNANKTHLFLIVSGQCHRPPLRPVMESQTWRRRRRRRRRVQSTPPPNPLQWIHFFIFYWMHNSINHYSVYPTRTALDANSNAVVGCSCFLLTPIILLAPYTIRVLCCLHICMVPVRWRCILQIGYARQRKHGADQKE